MPRNARAAEAAVDGRMDPFAVRTQLADLKSDLEIRDSLAMLYGARDFALLGEAPSFRWSVDFLKLRTLDVSDSSISAELSATFPAIDVVRMAFFKSGNSRLKIGSRAFETNPGEAFLLPSAAEFRREFAGASSTLLLRIDAASLRAKLAALIGRPVYRDLSFEIGSVSPTPATLRLQRLVELALQEVDHAGPIANDIVLAEFEELLTIAFLMANRNLHSHLLEGQRHDPAPWQVRLAEEFIAANWNKPLSIETIARETGIGIRSLFLTFKKARGYTPMNFLQQTRMQQARQMLQRADAITSVTAVGIKCGFASTGHFARYYRQAYGELPSDTLARAKGENKSESRGESRRAKPRNRRSGE